jgi:hypothetical protein
MSLRWLGGDKQAIAYPTVADRGMQQPRPVLRCGRGYGVVR